MKKRNGPNRAVWVFVLTLILSLCGGVALAQDGGQKLWSLLAELNEERFLLEQEKGAFGRWSIEDKHAWSQREIDAGYTSPIIVNGLPADGDITLDKAVEIALQALNEWYLGDPLKRFEMREDTYNFADPERPVWEIDYIGDNHGGYFLHYRVVIDAQTGEIVSAMDNLPTDDDGAALSSDTQSDSNPIVAAMDYSALEQALNQLAREENNGSEPSWTPERQYEAQELRREAGLYCSPEHLLLMPSDEYMPEADAIRIAEWAVTTAIPEMTEEILSDQTRCRVNRRLLAGDITGVTGLDTPAWEIDIQVYLHGGDNMTSMYRVRIDAATGTILSLYSGAKGWG